MLLTASGMTEENKEMSEGAMFTANDTRVENDRIFALASFITYGLPLGSWERTQSISIC